MKYKGFSLIELLVVISIIGVLLIFATVSYDSMQKKARDTRRKDDIKKIQAAYEQYFALCGGAYPLPDNNAVPENITCADPALTILAPAPVDPSGNSYPCDSCTESQYTILPDYETNESFEVTNQQ